MECGGKRSATPLLDQFYLGIEATREQRGLNSQHSMDKVTGIGGIFFKAQDPDKLRGWYPKTWVSKAMRTARPLNGGNLTNRIASARQSGRPFPHDTSYFNPSEKSFMINYRVANLDALLAELRSAGVQAEDRIEEYEYDRFAWIMDPEGNRLELWEPAEGW